MGKGYYRIAMILALVAALVGGWLLTKSRVAASAVQKNAAARAQLSDSAAIHAARRGFPFLNLTDGHVLLTSFEGEAAAVSLMASQASALRPLALTSADFDEDGVADLICTYDSPRGPMVAIYRGNVDALHPHSAEANQRRAQGTFTDAPFLAPARLFAAPVAGEFVVAGDVNGDGHADLVVTARASRSLYAMLGDGQGGFGATKIIGLPGAVTAMAAGDVNRADGLTDLLVGVTDDSGPRALIFEGRRGAVDAIPESLSLPAAATDFAVGRIDDDPYADIAIACGRSLTLLCGRDRGLVASAPTSAVKQPIASRHDFAFNINSMTAGRFGKGRLAAVGLLAEDGAVYALRAKPQKAKHKLKPRPPQLTVEKLSAAQSGATRLQMAHLSNLQADDLLVLDAAGRQMRVIETAAAKRGAVAANHSMAVDLDVEGEAVAALPMRLNPDALDDLVVLRRGDSAPTIMTSAPAAVFTVTNTGDNGGVDPMPGMGTGTLRQAIVDANLMAGADTIQFSIGSGLQTIVVSGDLPVITEPVTIDATTQPGFSGSPLIQLSAISSTGPGLDLNTNNSVVEGLIINGFSGAGIFIHGDGADNNIIIGNFIGTNASGTAAVGNGGGVSVATLNNQIGGTTSGAGNLLAGNNGSGVDIAFDSTGNVVRGNKIGTNVSGTGALPNSDQGVGITQATNNTIGGVTPGSGNLISGNNGSGIFMTNGVSGTLIQGNLIGTDAAGTGSLQNDDGIVLGSDSANVTIGGESTGAGNTIAFNQNAGVSSVSGTSISDVISGNSIFSNGGLGINLSDDMVTPNDNCDADTGANNLQNFPVLTSAASGGGQTVVQGTLDSLPNATFIVEFFSNAGCDSVGNGEGRTFLGSTSVTTGPSCTRNFTATLPVAVAAGEVVTATAISSTGDTSEFSSCVTVTAASANLSIEVGGMPDPVPAGSDLQFDMQVANGGPSNALGVTLTEQIPLHTTFKSLVAPTGWSCSTPSVGGTGTITCTTSGMSPGETADFTLIVTVDPSTPTGTTITFAASVESDTPDPDTSNNSGEVAISVIAASCAIICPPNITANSSAAQCGSAINYPVPSAALNCAVSCAPPPGAFFAVGTTTVTCSASGGSSCSFTVTVVDNTPPAITCPLPFTVAADRRQTTAVVNYVPATATDACGVADVICLPPSGSTFALGTATVNCTARDVAGNASSCSFTVTVNDADAPVISCPQNITMELPATQTSAVINYPLPTATDNQPGVVVTCAPPSGSTFPLGVSTVICVATDVSGNRATCGFSVSLTGGPANIEVIIPTGRPSLEFGADQPVSVPRKNRNRASGPCAAFTIVNRSFSPLNLTLDAIRRLGSDVDSGRISDPREGDLYSLSIVNASGPDTPLDINGTLTIPVGGRVSFCLRFTPTVPAVASGTTQLSAPQVIPDQIASRVIFRVAGGSTLSVNVNALVETAVRLINPNNPKKPATLIFTKSGDEFSVTFAAYDANNDVRSARYEFLDAGGTLVAGPFDVDLVAAIRERNLTRGQSFSVTQRFTGANSNRNVVAVRVTVTDGETSVTSPAVPLDAAASAAVQTAARKRFLSVLLPSLRMNPSWP